jgi:hypothetical protein
MVKEKGDVAMRDDTAIFNKSGEHVANIKIQRIRWPPANRGSGARRD